jgi:hypothetical protein
MSEDRSIPIAAGNAVHINGRVYNVPKDGTMVGVMNVTDDYVDLIYAGGEIVRCLHAVSVGSIDDHGTAA